MEIIINRITLAKISTGQNLIFIDTLENGKRIYTDLIYAENTQHSSSVNLNEPAWAIVLKLGAALKVETRIISIPDDWQKQLKEILNEENITYEERSFWFYDDLVRYYLNKDC